MANGNTDWGTKLYRIYTTIVTTIIIPVAVWTFNMYTSFVVLQTEHTQMKADNQRLRSMIENESKDRIADIKDVRDDLSDFRDEYYTDFPKNYHRYLRN